MRIKKTFALTATSLFISNLFLSGSLCYADEAMVVQQAGLTVYNQNQALIRQKYHTELEKGINHLYYESVAKTIDPNSIDLRSADKSQSIVVKEQSYESNSTENLLSASYGKNVSVRNFFENGQSMVQSGLLVKDASGTVLKIGDHYIIRPQGQIEINDLPSNSMGYPKIGFVVYADKGGGEDLNLSYQANSINWLCNYTVVLNEKQNKFDFIGYATIENHCGISFHDANLKLMAGNVHNLRRMPRFFRTANEGVNLQGEQAFTENPFADYHLYDYDQPVNINNEETKKLLLISGESIPVVKKYIFDDQRFDFLPFGEKPKYKLS